MTAAQLCELIQGELEGDGTVEITGPAQIDKASPGTVTFLANPKYEQYLYETQASVIIISRDIRPRQPVAQTLIKVDDAYASMLGLAARFAGQGEVSTGVSPMAVIPEGTDLGEEVSIGPYVVLGKGVRIGRGSRIHPHATIGSDVTIGEGVTIHSGVRIYAQARIGDRCILHANAVIGCDGFGYRPDASGAYQKIPHIGSVILEPDVEIGANTVIDRATFGETRIRRGVKIDNLVQVAHNVTIGEDTVIAAQAGIAGSTHVGSHSRIGGQVGIVGHLSLSEGLEVQAQSGIQSDKHPAGTRLFGSPAIEYQSYLRAYAAFRRMPDYIRRLEALERTLSTNKNEEA